jgi:hypothetical protein
MRASVFPVLAMLPSLVAQAPTAATAPTTTQQVQRLARALELPEQRAAAIDSLLQLGEPAVPALLAQARHPDLAIARIALRVLVGLEHAGLAAVPALQELAKGSDAHALAAAWALARLPWRGTFLVPSMEEGLVRELDADGKEIWKSEKVGQVWSAQRLANGNLLTAEVNGAAREYDAAGKMVWEQLAKNVYTAERQIDGNTLIASYGDRRVFEVDPAGTEVWSQPNLCALFATRLPNELTLMCDYNGKRVLEVDASGAVAWELGDCPQSYTCHRLRDGRTLVVTQEKNRAHIRARDGKQDAELTLNAQPSDVVLLPDGWIECGNRYVRRCDGKGKELWNVATQGWAGRITLR